MWHAEYNTVWYCRLDRLSLRCWAPWIMNKSNTPVACHHLALRRWRRDCRGGPSNTTGVILSCRLEPQGASWWFVTLRTFVLICCTVKDSYVLDIYMLSFVKIYLMERGRCSYCLSKKRKEKGWRAYNVLVWFGHVHAEILQLNLDDSERNGVMWKQMFLAYMGPSVGRLVYLIKFQPNQRYYRTTFWR